MTQKFKFIALFCLFLCSNNSVAQDLWSNVTTSMSPIDIAQIRSDTIEVKNGDSWGNSKELLRISNLTMMKKKYTAGKNFSVSFYFEQNKVNKISLKYKTPKSLVECSGMYNSLLDSLTAKYGEPLSNRNNRTAFISDNFEAKWSVSGKDIRLIYFGSSSERSCSMLSLSYKVSATDADEI